MILSDLLDKNIETFGEYPFIYFKDKKYSNLDIKNYSNKIAHGLKKLGVAKGDRVVVCMPNCPEVIFSYQGIIRAGAIIVPIMFTLHDKEIHYIIKDCQAKVVITSSLSLEKVESALDNLEQKPVVLVVDQPTDENIFHLYDTDITENELYVESDLKLNAEDTAVILYTSGTTGKPKGVMLTHKNLYSNAENTFLHNETKRGVTLGILPLAHVYGLTISNTCFLTGSSAVVFNHFDPKAVFEAIEKYKVTNFSAVPAMIFALLSYPHSNKFQLGSLEWVASGSAPLPVALLHAFKQKFGADILEGYGLSEAAPVVAAHQRDSVIKPGSVGIPIPGVEVKIVNNDESELATGQVGELIVRGDNITPGYYQNEIETKQVLKGSWLYTGDMAYMDTDGYLFIVDRKKDLIIRGGFNIYPRDVEELLAKHEAVAESSVVGIPNDQMGEEVVAYVVKKDKQAITEEELIQYCQGHLSKNKTPRKIIFIDQLPRNGVGKILKTHLRKLAENIKLSPLQE
ncbi:long-chain-fatty-acid--CoA ligase [Bacillus sp. SCS-151]|uniref:long-chain-fatty-acid--CoA ligase n=1 Tax=Nanhaiella sioensis TaxID=3115293 RepID=UPI00397E6D46